MSGFGSGFGVLAGLADSEFLSDVDAHDRDTARLAMTLAGGVTLGFGAATLVGFALGGLPHTLQDLLFDTAANGMLWLTFVALAALIAHHRLRAYLTAATHIRWRLLALGLGLSLLALMPVVVANILTAPANRSLAGAWASIAPNGLLIAVLSTALLIPAAAAEELFFRGWLLRQTAAFTRRPVILIVLTALIFSAIHRDFNPDTFLSRMLLNLAGSHQRDYQRRHPLVRDERRKSLRAGLRSYEKVVALIDAGKVEAAVAHWRLHLANANATWAGRGEGERIVDSLGTSSTR